MSTRPTFFFSHTRQDRETGNYLDRFFSDLEDRLAQWAAVPDGQRKQLGIIDREVLQGSDWNSILSKRLGTDKCLVAIMTPPFFTRDNCGKELFGFVLRSRQLGLDSNGSLSNVENVLAIRWLPEAAYRVNGENDARIPILLQRINHRPADDRSDEETTKAIERYVRKGLEQMVSGGDGYLQVLSSFVQTILDMNELRAADPIMSFADLQDAFTYDWANHFSQKGAQPSEAEPLVAPEPLSPTALSSIVVFYITNRSLTPDNRAVNFANQLVAEPRAGTTINIDPALAALLIDVGTAAEAERLTVFHAAANPTVPAQADELIAQLAALSTQFVLTVVVIDPDVWPGDRREVAVGAEAVEQMIRSTKWIGPVLLPSWADTVTDVNRLVKTLDLPPRLELLPGDSNNRIATLRQSFVDTRGRILSSMTNTVPGAEAPPSLKSPSAKDN